MERELARYVRMKFHLTAEQIDDMGNDQYEELCEMAVANERHLAENPACIAWQNAQNFVDYLMSRRP